MVGHDSSALEAQRQRLLESISKSFVDQTIDLKDIASFSNDPMVLAALLFKLAEERQKTNQLMSEWKEKNVKQFDDIMFELKTYQFRQSGASALEHAHASGAPSASRIILPEPDQKIVAYIERSGSATAQEIQLVLNYRGKNAACQRLNNLAKSGVLKKMQSGKKVVYLPPGA